ncbi:hypothetical protein K438DRAFT_1772392 [Mycena galopus ATCC 62051]|nr:hypothetical protein K438DRAFT_1772392 [Mycena galopus ATCC 62051]
MSSLLFSIAQIFNCPPRKPNHAGLSNSLFGTIYVYWDLKLRSTSLSIDTKTSIRQLDSSLTSAQSRTVLWLQPPYIYLEARILVEEFEEKKGCSAPSFVLTSRQQKKRKSTFDAANPQAKKFRGILSSTLPPLKSQFRPVGTYTNIFVATATTKVDDEAGVVNTMDPDLGDPELKVEKCEIAKELVGKGMSQYVYKLSREFFAKNRGPSRSSSILVTEGIRSPCWKTGRNFTKRRPAYIKWASFCLRFMSVLKRPTLTLIKCQLVIKVLKEGKAPSEASGYSLSEVQGAECPMFWLIEPFRLGCAEKWSGTNQHPNHSQNKLGNILNSILFTMPATIPLLWPIFRRRALEAEFHKSCLISPHTLAPVTLVSEIMDRTG